MKTDLMCAVAIRTLLGSLALALGVPSPVQAQAQARVSAVHTCQADGRTVFQSSPCRVEARIATSVAPTAADPAAAPKKKTLADMLRERDGADRGQAPARPFQGDGANVLRSRMGAV